MRKYFTMGLASSTQRTYKSGKERYLKFCQLAGASPLPGGESILCRFCAYLANDGLCHRTMTGATPLSKLQYVLRGIKRSEASSRKEPRERLPITPRLLKQMKGAWQTMAEDQRDRKMLWAACCICFFVFLRVGEMSVPSDNEYDPAVHLSVGDIPVDNPREPSMVRIHIKQSKTDPFRKGINLFVGKTSSDL